MPFGEYDDVICQTPAPGSRIAQEREGLPDGVNIPRMAKPLLEEFDLAGRLLLFCG
jgi:hypothetical protein